ncbi:hypothetical protein EVG20_g11501 [Dentipellis fragilis]|uniref:HAT C-terminal dimerisation domain-containing protein n=1 Tax=Dentipellis fragilis TaxID=205917 RepID=A0A4Y9XMA8_9AGAM|nr:hypothetical protein EVG20_g11501 [Dentipellis fragilis]
MLSSRSSSSSTAKLAYIRGVAFGRAISYGQSTTIYGAYRNRYLSMAAMAAMKHFIKDDFFASIDNFGMSTTSDELEDYFAAPAFKNVANPIAFWEQASDTPLSRMVHDFLSSPAAGTGVERAFSRGGLTVSKHCFNLSDVSVKVATVLSSWGSVEGLVLEAAIKEAFKQKAARPKKGTVVTDVIDEVEDSSE